MKNDYEVRGDVTAIFLKSKKYGDMETIIDTRDLMLADSFINNWYAYFSPTSKGYYVRGNYPKTTKKQEKVIFHRFLMSATHGKQIDHINHETLDNRRSCNLREVTLGQNQQNKRISIKNKSGVLGVSWYKNYGKWIAQISVNGTKTFVGYFDNLSDAEQAMIEARIKYHPYSQEATFNEKTAG